MRDVAVDREWRRLVGSVLRERREQALGSSSLSELARRLGMSHSYLSRVERGEAAPNPGLIEAYEETLGLPSGEVLREARAARSMAARQSSGIQPEDATTVRMHMGINARRGAESLRLRIDVEALARTEAAVFALVGRGMTSSRLSSFYGGRLGIDVEYTSMPSHVMIFRLVEPLAVDERITWILDVDTPYLEDEMVLVRPIFGTHINRLTMTTDMGRRYGVSEDVVFQQYRWRYLEDVWQAYSNADLTHNRHKFTHEHTFDQWPIVIHDLVTDGLYGVEWKEPRG